MFRFLFAVAIVATVVPVAHAQRAEVRSSETVYMPAPVDSNSPAHWSDGQLYILNSSGMALVSQGVDQYLQGETVAVDFDGYDHYPVWMEATWQDSDGTLYGWYHHEPGGICPGGSLTAPSIGAAVSFDNGRSFHDLGTVLSSGDAPNCAALNGFFAGGHGDFTVIADRRREYLYFLFTNYGGDPADHGVAMARMALRDRTSPAGAVWKHFGGEWNEPGLGGRVTAIFPAVAGWDRADTNSFWGPSVHWNYYLGSYVVLMNHACCAPRWPQEGIYVAFNRDLANPAAWTEPQKILEPRWYYPQVLGTLPGETDKRAGREARLYVKGVSQWTIVFSRWPARN